MKTRLQCKADWLEEQTRCPNCHSGRRYFIRSPDHFEGQLVSGDHLTPEGAKVCALFFCGAEFIVNASDIIVNTIPCYEPSQIAASDLDEKAEEIFEDQDVAA